MSEVSETAIVRLLLADYTATDNLGKLNIIGGGLSIVGRVDVDSAPKELVGFTVPFGLIVSVTVEPKLYRAESFFELTLEDSNGEIVELPGSSDQGQMMKIEQNLTFEEPERARTMGVPRGTLRARTNWVIMFGTGLPLRPSKRYMWRVTIDNNTRDDWTEEFYVLDSASGRIAD